MEPTGLKKHNQIFQKPQKISKLYLIQVYGHYGHYGQYRHYVYYFAMNLFRFKLSFDLSIYFKHIGCQF